MELIKGLSKRLLLMILGITVLLLSTPSYAQYGYNPFTNNLDKIGDSGASGTMPAFCESTDDFCFIYEDNVLKLYVNGDIQAQFPSTATFDFILLETGDFLLLENGSQLIME